MEDNLKNKILEDYLAHHGVKGQKWGVRRYQNYDGTLTGRGIKRYDESVRTRQRKRGYEITSEMRKYGKSEDNMSYKYQKPGESAWIGLGRAIKEATKTRINNLRENHKKKENPISTIG